MLSWKLKWNKRIASVLVTAVLSAQVLGGVAMGTVWGDDLVETASVPAEDIEVHLIGINDFHGQLDTVSTVTYNGTNKPVGTAAILATYLNEARAKYTYSLLFHNGDSVGASAPVSSLERDEPTHEWMNLMKFDVGSLGNHEFDQGVEALMTQLNGGVDPKNGSVTHAGSNFDYVNANAVDSTTGTPIIDPYVIKEVGGVKIGFIGLVTKSTPSKVSPAGTAGVRFLTPEEEVVAVEGYAKELQDQGVETIIVLAHDPATTKTDATTKVDVTTGEAADLANALPANSPIDVIVAGDNHALANGVVNNKLIVQAYSYGTAFEDIKLLIDPETGDVTSKSAKVTTTFHEGVTPDVETVALVNKYLALHPELTKPVGTTDGTVTRTDTYNRESSLGNLIADAMRSADFGDGEGTADFAFMNPGGIRADLPNGDVTFGDLAKIQPFGNTLVKLTLTGAQIKTLLQQQWNVKADGTPDVKTLQISGLKYKANMYLPVAERIASLTLADGTLIKPNQNYTAVVNNFMAAGGDNYKILTEASASVAGPIDLDVFYDYIVKTFKGGAITAPIDGRIINILTAPSTEDIEVHLLGINDFHGQLDTVSTVSNKPVGTAAILATYLKEARAKYANSLLFHNGDSVGASAPVSSLERDEPTHEWMNLMKFDVGSLGNHEFDQGVEALMTQLNGGVDPKNGSVTHAGSNFDYVNANAVDSTTGTPIIDPYVIKEVGGVKIGFIGLVTKSTPSKVSPAGTAGVRFLTPEEEVVAVEGYAKELQAKGVETIIVLAHDPATTKTDATTKVDVTTGEAADLANELPANSPIDVIVAGDNHALANGVVNGKLIVQAYSYGTAFEDIKLIIDPITGDVKNKSAVVTSTFHEGVTPDAETVALVDKYLALHPELTKPVGTTDGTVTRTDTYNRESSLGNLIADAMRSADFGDGKGTADFAFMNPGGIRADLPNGDVTFGDLAKIQPFGNTLVKLTLTGAQIKTLLQQQWNVKADGTPDVKTLQISGLKYKANMYLPVAERIASLTLADGTLINSSQSYTAVVNNFMAAGGDNYKILTEASASVAGPIDLDVFYDYIVKTFKGGAITAPIDGRIINILTAPSTTNPPSTSGPSPSTTPTSNPSTVPSTTPSPTPPVTPVPTVVPVPDFKDLGKVAWAQVAIESLAAKGILKGMDANTFAPTKNVTRAEFVTMLVRALNLTSTGTGNAFKDVKENVWYSDSIAIAVNLGIVKGSGDGKFEPNREITREEIAIMVANALREMLKAIDKDAALNKFTDKSNIASYAQEAVAQLVNLGIIMGIDAKEFAPKSIANRSQAAVIIYRMLEKAS